MVPWCAVGLRQTIQTPITHRQQQQQKLLLSTSLPSSAMPSDRRVIIVLKADGGNADQPCHHIWCQYHAVSLQTFTRRRRSAPGARKKRRITVLPEPDRKVGEQVAEDDRSGQRRPYEQQERPHAAGRGDRDDQDSEGQPNSNSAEGAPWCDVSSVSTPKCARHGRARRRNRNCAAMPPATNTMKMRPGEADRSRATAPPSGRRNCARREWAGICLSSTPTSHSRERIPRSASCPSFQPAVAVAPLGRTGGGVSRVLKDRLADLRIAQQVEDGGAAVRREQVAQLS